MKRAGELRQQAERHRRLKRQVSDPAAVKAMRDLACEFESDRSGVGKTPRISERAHEIWIEQGRPEGRDLEFWLAAERELDANEGHLFQSDRGVRRRA